MDALHVLALWVHTVALVIAWGYYGILGRIVLPTLEQSLEPKVRGETLLAIERRALPLVLLAVGLFAASGVYLLIIDPHYAGIGTFFASTWATLMLVKHGFVVALIAVGVYVDFLVWRVADAAGDEARRAADRRLRLSVDTATALGALIVLLTAAAQVTG